MCALYIISVCDFGFGFAICFLNAIGHLSDVGDIVVLSYINPT
jgi:hypothetical protein